MKVIRFLFLVRTAAILCLLAAPRLCHPDETPSDNLAQAASARLLIRANGEAPWGGRTVDVEKVLYSAADQLWRYFPQRQLPTLLVEPKGGPITLYRRGPNGEIQVRLNTGNRLWAQHAYQFAHEFGHVLANYREGEHRNKWFEESICELASLFALRRMAERWQESPPYPNWKDYSAALAKYAQERIEPARLPEGTTLAQWYQQHAAALAANPVMRDKNTVVATALLPLFEQRPEHWEAIGYLNLDRPDSSQTFRAYLVQWQSHAPASHQPFISDVARQFGLDLR